MEFAASYAPPTLVGVHATGLPLGLPVAFPHSFLMKDRWGAPKGNSTTRKIFVLPVEKVYRIRTGEEDTAAVTPVGVT
jgi:hypothetical protein